MGRFSNSLAMAKASWRVLLADKELLVFPLLGFLATVLVLGVFGALAWITVDQTTVPATTAAASTTEYEPTALTWVAGVLGYFAATFAGMFFLSALVAGAYQRFQGGDPSVGSALSGAAHRLPQILGWSLVVTTVGLIIQAIESRAGFVGVLIARGIGMAWQIVTWLAVPVIVVEGTGPFSSLKSAAGLFKKTWGENIIAQVGFGVLGVVAAIPGLLVGGGLIWLGPAANVILGVVLVVLWVAVVSLVISALNGIYRTALYLYASTGQVPPAFPAQAMQNAFRPRGTGISSLFS
ncbi:MAG: DUF6159 family protein [Acidimicrobiia bacterium]|nr:DUF6159 family protein [Acidimicrobiia bacterium]